MSCDYYKPLMMGYVDDELEPEQREEFVCHMRECEPCAAETIEFQRLAAITDGLKLKEPTDVEIERFWTSIYNRLERSSGWVLFGFGVLLLGGYGMFRFLAAERIDVAWRIGGGSLALGATLLFTSVLRHRLRTLRFDRYRGVKR